MKHKWTVTDDATHNSELKKQLKTLDLGGIPKRDLLKLIHVKTSVYNWQIASSAKGELGIIRRMSGFVSIFK